jgi:ParB family chromosome partitioning protein
MSKKNDFSTLDLISAYEGKTKSTETISLKDIEPSPNQPRQFGKNNVDDLVDSMKRMGLIEPIVVRKNNSKYMIVAGERRFHAAERLGWKEIPAIITEANPELCYEMALAENEKRKSLNPWEGFYKDRLQLLPSLFFLLPDLLQIKQREVYCEREIFL